MPYVYWPLQQNLELTTHGSLIKRTNALFIQAPVSVPALDSAGCSCGCRVPSSGAVVTVQRVRRRLQNVQTRLDSRSKARSRKLVRTRPILLRLAS